jgi:hypothetical protein
MKHAKSIFAFGFIFFVCVLLLVAVLLVSVFGDHSYRKELMLRNDATNMIDFQMVDSATNIFFYSKVGGMQSLDEYVRLTVAKRDVTNQINVMVVKNNHDYNRNLPYFKTNLVSSDIISQPSPSAWERPISWWTPDKITNGYYVGEIDSYAYQIWVHESSGTLFIHCND